MGLQLVAVSVVSEEVKPNYRVSPLRSTHVRMGVIATLSYRPLGGDQALRGFLI